MMNRGIAEIITIVAIVFLGIGSIFAVQSYITSQQQADSSQDKVFKENQNTAIQPVEKQVTDTAFEEFPFMELTIPYFRSLDFNSSLTDLDLYQEKENYTSYTTSYQSEGFKINSYLTIPKGNMPAGGWPAIVFIHGYIPPTIYKTTDNYVNYVDYYARNGFVVIKPDLRGHDDSEGEAFGAYFSGGYVIDTLNAISALENFDQVNPTQIGLWGHSMGGNIVFRTLVAKQDIPAAVIWAGAVYTYEDMQEYSIDDNSYRPPTDDSARRRYREELNNTYGGFDPESEFWQKVVPTNYLDGVTTKLQIQHSRDDSVVDIEYSRNLGKILQNSGINFELEEYSGGGHNIISPYYEEAMQSSLNFFKRNLIN